MKGIIVGVFVFSVLFPSWALSDDAFPLPDTPAGSTQFAYDNLEALSSGGPDKGTSSNLRPSLELRRLYNINSPMTIPRPRGFPALLASLGLLGHAAVRAVKDWNTVAVPRPYVSLLLGRARFDTSNLALFSLIGGLTLFYLGMKRRWRNHKERNLWRLDELLRQDRARVHAIKMGMRSKL